MAPETIRTSTGLEVVCNDDGSGSTLISQLDIALLIPIKLFGRLREFQDQKGLTDRKILQEAVKLRKGHPEKFTEGPYGVAYIGSQEGDHMGYVLLPKEDATDIDVEVGRNIQEKGGSEIADLGGGAETPDNAHFLDQLGADADSAE
jgi:hypothetical protein